ncbi:MBOAT family O-acyltransferase [Saccharicrinis sp. FJH2]|uniref:MBOAT family O-acyltransferase n=1 Tax=Saccharicrinis sp. FJH65 TaxID=3344659 RepID=UPI0035F44464
MLFNSIDFVIFLPVVFILYWFTTSKNLQFQNILVVAASYVFYGWWDWRFLSLIMLSTLVDYTVGLQLGKEENRKKRKVLLWISIIVNIGLLGYFKYYNFFLDNFIEAFKFFGSTFNSKSLQIILPVGISFYTFQTLSYTIDVYKRKLEPTRDLIAFSAFVSFFPQLVAGPIERATHLLPQFYSKRNFDYSKAVNGMRQILWGLFKKVVIADNCAEFANTIFNHSTQYSGSTLLLGAIFFAFQIYGDFSGYSDIAIGTSRLFGFDIMKNFAFPYFSRNIGEFWRRWHISLSTWFRDYVYIPLGGSKGSKWQNVRNIFIIFLVSGFWHGAKWTFIAWGALNAIYFLPLLLTKSNRKYLNIPAEGKVIPGVMEIFSIGITFLLATLGWIFFRSESMGQAMHIFSKVFSKSIFSMPYFENGTLAIPTIILTIIFLITEWFGRADNYAIEKLALKWNKYLRYSFYYLIIFALFWFGGKEQQFIYFQF